MTVEKIISGGQTGADMGGLIAGRSLGLQTGGTAPPNFMTEKGPNITLKAYGLTEGRPDPKIYPKRTLENVKNSDGTIILGNTTSPGSKLTITFCRKLNRPFILNPDVDTLKRWLQMLKITILNVAGNRESKNPGIQHKTAQLLIDVLKDQQEVLEDGNA